MTNRSVFTFSCLIVLLVCKVVSAQEAFDKQAEREKQFEGQAPSSDPQAEESKRSPTGKFLLLKGEIHDDDGGKSDLSLLDRLMPSKTKVIIDAGAAFPFPPPPPPPPAMLPPQFLLPPPLPPPGAFIPSVIIGATGDFGPLPIGPQIEPQKGESDQANQQSQKPNFDGMMRQGGSSEGSMMQNGQTQEQHFQGDMQNQETSDWTGSHFRMMLGGAGGGGGDMQQQQESAQRFQGMMPLDLQQQEQSSGSSQRFPGASSFQQEESQHFPGMMGDSINTPQQQQSSRFDSPPESSWSNPQDQQGPGSNPQRFPSPNGDMAGKMQQEMSSSPLFQLEPESFNGKSNKKNKEKGKNGQKSDSNNISDMKPEPEPAGCGGCGAMFKQTGWGHLKRCAKRCAAHHHHHQKENHNARANVMG